MIERAEGTDLIDDDGSRYIDGTSSLWCNVHGHRHPAIDAAIREQLDRVAHSTMLGLTHAPAAELAARLVEIAPPGLTSRLLLGLGLHARPRSRSRWPSSTGVSAAASTRGAPRSSGSPTATTATRSEPSRSAGSTSSTAPTSRCSSPSTACPPGDAEALATDARALRRGDRGGDRRAARAGRRRHPRPAARLPAAGPRALRRPRRAADLRRGRDRLRPHRHDVRLRAGAGRSRPALPRQGPDERLHAARRDPGHRAHLRRLPRRARGLPHLLPRPHVHRQPARLRRRDRQSLDVFAAEHTLLRVAAEDPAASTSCSGTSRRWTRSPRSAAGG